MPVDIVRRAMEGALGLLLVAGAALATLAVARHPSLRRPTTTVAHRAEAADDSHLADTSHPADASHLADDMSCPPAAPALAEARPPSSRTNEGAPPKGALTQAGPPTDDPPEDQPHEDQPPRHEQAPARRDPARSRLFHYGAVDSHGQPHTGPYACLHLFTTGLSPGRDRIVEIAVVRCGARGEILGEWCTVVDAEGRAIPMTWLHGLTPGAAHGAPTFADVASDLLASLEGAVVVAHNAELTESFLSAAFLACGVLAPALPALPLARLAAQTLHTPNTRLATLAQVVGTQRALPSSALADARLVAAVLPAVLTSCGARISYPVDAIRPTNPRHRRRPRLLSRAPLAAAVVPSGYLADLVAAMPASAAEQNDPRLAAYLDALSAVLPRGIVAEEVRELTQSAVRSGYRADALRAVHQRVLESLRVAAFARGRVGGVGGVGGVSEVQVRHLRAVAHSLGAPTYFDDLIVPATPAGPPPGSGTFSRPVRKPPPPRPPAQAPRCGHCLAIGHYTAQCPQVRRARGAIGPVGPVPGFDPIDPIGPI